MPECGVSAGLLLRPFLRRRLLRRGPGTGRLVPEGIVIRSGRRVVGDGAAQVGALAVHQLLVAMGVGRGGGLPVGVQGAEGFVQGALGPASGTDVVDEISLHIAHVQ